MIVSSNHYCVTTLSTSFFFLDLLPPSSSSSELLFLAEPGSLGRPVELMLDLLPPPLGVELELLFFLYVFMNSAMSSGQSRFFSGSHVLCLLWTYTGQQMSIHPENPLQCLVFRAWEPSQVTGTPGHKVSLSFWFCWLITVTGSQFLRKVACCECIRLKIGRSL